MQTQRRLLPGLALLLLACSVFQPRQSDATPPRTVSPTSGADPTSSVSATRPDDFDIQYEWREGSLPPPHHFEISIHIGPDGGSSVVMVPNYPGEGVPEWTEPFTLDAAALDNLYALILEKRVFSTQWQEDDGPPVGGSNSWADITANGTIVRLSEFVESDQAADARAVLAAIRHLVPADLLDKLEGQRQQYIDEFPE